MVNCVLILNQALQNAEEIGFQNSKYMYNVS